MADLLLEATEVGADDVVRAGVTLTNTGDRTAYEVVQADVTHVVTSVTWGPRSSRSSNA